MIIYEDGEQFNVPSKWLADHDKQIRDETISNCIKALKQVCAKRPSIVMFDSDIEEMEKELDKIKEEQNRNEM